MSAHLIDADACILLAVWSTRRPGGMAQLHEVSGAAVEIYRTNVESLRTRYPGDNADGMRHDMLHYTEAELSDRVTDGRHLAALDYDPTIVWRCSAEAEYQCCEFMGWSRTPGGLHILAARREAGDHMARRLDPGRDRGWPTIELHDSGAVSLTSLMRGR